MTYLLRAEAVNLGNFVYDTNKIQPTRGGSFLLLDSVQKIAEPDKTGKKQEYAGATLDKITTGASIGLYSFSATDNDQAEKVVNAVHAALSGFTDGHATFAVACVKDTGDFKTDLLQLQTKVRWRQYQQPTLVLPVEKSAKEECAYDGVRPGVVEIHQPEGKLFISDSVSYKINTENGKLREKIYSRILKKNISYEFTKNIEELAAPNHMGKLDNKIAFIYLDGNKFTKIRTSLCDKSKLLEKFSEIVEDNRSKFLAALLEKADKDEYFKTKDNQIRLETLLWGGDELEIIVPAWKGWEVLHSFFDAMKDVHFEKSATDEKAPLTHAGGIVFCNCKAPIREIRRMAHELADMAKDAIKPAFKTMQDIQTKVTHKEHDTFHCLVLESFDTVGGKVKPFAQNYFGKTIWENMRLSAEDMDKLNEAIDTMKKNGFPRNKIFDIVWKVKNQVEERERLQSEGQDTSQLKEEQTKQMHNDLEKVLDGVENKDDIKNKIADFIGGKIEGGKIIEGEIERWFVISELWDYVRVGGAQ